MGLTTAVSGWQGNLQRIIIRAKGNTEVYSRELIVAVAPIWCDG